MTTEQTEAALRQAKLALTAKTKLEREDAARLFYQAYSKRQQEQDK